MVLAREDRQSVRPLRGRVVFSSFRGYRRSANAELLNPRTHWQPFGLGSSRLKRKIPKNLEGFQEPRECCGMTVNAECGMANGEMACQSRCFITRAIVRAVW